MHLSNECSFYFHGCKVAFSHSFLDVVRKGSCNESLYNNRGWRVIFGQVVYPKMIEEVSEGLEMVKE